MILPVPVMITHPTIKILKVNSRLKNTLTYLLTAFLFVISNLTVNAQQHHAGHIKGIVTTIDGAPAQGISIKIKNTPKGTVASTNGSFEFRNIQPGSYLIEFSMVGYTTTTAEAVVTEEKPTADLAVQLDLSSRKLDEVIITSGGNRFAKKESDDISKMPISNMENPQVYSVVSKELMKEQIVTDYNSAFKNVPGAGIAEVRNQGRTTSYQEVLQRLSLFATGWAASLIQRSIRPILNALK